MISAILRNVSTTSSLLASVTTGFLMSTSLRCRRYSIEKRSTGCSSGLPNNSPPSHELDLLDMPALSPQSRRWGTSNSAHGRRLGRTHPPHAAQRNCERVDLCLARSSLLRELVTVGTVIFRSSKTCAPCWDLPRKDCCAETWALISYVKTNRDMASLQPK